jgi:hypothetical protein
MFVPQEDRTTGPQVGIATVCADAAALLRKEGWLPMNPVRAGKPGFCLAVALATVAHYNWGYYSTIIPLILQAAYIQTGKQWRDIPQYNDAPGRTFEEILAVLDMVS